MKRYEIQKDDLEIEPDSIIDTQTNVLYECNSGDMNELCKILNKQDNKWQKLKEWVKNKSIEIKRVNAINEEMAKIKDYIDMTYRECYIKIQELEQGEKDEV